MKTLWFDCSSGVSGDMLIGSLVSAGAPFPELEKSLAELPVEGLKVSVRKVKRRGMAALKFDAAFKEQTLPPARMRELIESSGLAPEIKKKTLDVLKKIFRAEAVVHGTTPARVHLHELGSPDTLIDIAGTFICLQLLELPRVCASPVNLGGGSVETGHGRLTVPAPVTAYLASGMPVYTSDAGFELATPTGVVLLNAVSDGFGPMPRMRLLQTGTGAGGRELREQPNILRAFLGEPEGAGREEDVTLMETNIDDMDPRVYGYLIDKLLSAGALDAYLAPIIMKKSRPAVTLGVICKKEDARRLAAMVFAETTTLGIREHTIKRTVLDRQLATFDTPFGPVRYKMAGQTARPEYEDCARIARETGLPLIEVIRRLARGPARKQKQ